MGDQILMPLVKKPSTYYGKFNRKVRPDEYVACFATQLNPTLLP